MIFGSVFATSCFDPLCGLPALPDKSVDHVITDPPYEEYVHAGNRRSQRSGGEIVAPEMGFAAITQRERELCAREFVRLSRGWVLVFCALEGVRPWQEALIAAGARRRNTMLWVKTNAAPKFAGDGPAMSAEAIVTVWAGRGRSIWNAGGAHGHYLAKADRVDRLHPTQKPLDLMRQLIADFTRPGDLVLDPYAGSGTTLVAAAQLGRLWCGYELDPQHATIAQRRALNALPLPCAARAPKSPRRTHARQQPRAD